MTQQFSDDKQFAAFLRGAVQALPVPEPPREAMWAAIAAQRHGSVQTSAAAVSGLAQRQQERQHERSTVWARSIPVRFALPLAAGFLVVGAGLGVVMGKRSVSSPMAQPSAQIADGQIAEGTIKPLPKALPAQLGAASHYESVGKLVSYFSTFPAVIGDVDNANMSGAEAEAEAEEDRKTRIVLNVLATQLLSTTQVMLDSPDLDEQRLELLRDIERILTQIVDQLSTGALPSDRLFIEQDIMNTQLMKRLETAAPVIQQGV